MPLSGRTRDPGYGHQPPVCRSLLGSSLVGVVGTGISQVGRDKNENVRLGGEIGHRMSG
jgi:hypothetical protein